MAKKTPTKTGKGVGSSFVNVARRRRTQKMVFLVLTVILGLGLVGSSVFWAFDPGSKPHPEAGEVYQREMPLEERIADLETRLKEDARNMQLMKQLASLYWEAGRGRRRWKHTAGRWKLTLVPWISGGTWH